MTPTELDDRIRRTYHTVVPDLLAGPDTPTVGDEAPEADLTWAEPRSRRRHALALVVTAAVIVAAAGGWMVSRRGIGVRGVRSPATTVAPAPTTRWMPADVPSGWRLGWTGARLHNGRGLFVADGGDGQAVALTLYDGGFSDMNAFTDAVDLDGRKGDIGGSRDRFSLRLGISSWGASFETYGLDETQVRELGRTIALSPADGSPGPVGLPPGFGRWVQIADDDISQVDSWWTGPRTMTRIIVSRRPAALATYLRATGGRLEARTIGSNRILVGGAATGRQSSPSNGVADPTASAFIERDGVGIAVIGADERSGDDIARIIPSVREVDAATVVTDPNPPGRSVTGDTCDTAPVDALRLPFEGFEIEAFPSGTSVCVREYQGSPPQLTGGAQLDNLGLDSFSGGSAQHAYTMGMAPDDVTSVIVENRDGTRTAVDTHPMAGTGTRIWVAGVSPDSGIRALEYRDASGSLIRRTGRPPA